MELKFTDESSEMSKERFDEIIERIKQIKFTHVNQDEHTEQHFKGLPMPFEYIDPDERSREYEVAFTFALMKARSKKSK